MLLTFLSPFFVALPADREAFNELLEYHLVAQVYLVIQQHIIYNSNNNDNNNIIEIIMSNTTTKNTNSKSKEEPNWAPDR